VDVTFHGWNDAWLDEGFRAWNIEDCIDYIRVPVLAIHGKDDQYGTEAQIDALAERLLAPLETVMLDDCGHAPFIDQPRLTLDAISDFITRLDRIESRPGASTSCSRCCR
jgi:pimeloyl-ACP methyl ester carboxylesterase